MKALWGLALLLLTFSTETALSETLIFPQELQELAKQHDCSQVSDFYDRPGMIQPPYVYGYVPGEEESAAFWCEREGLGTRTYFLVFDFRTTAHENTKCPDKIEWPNGYPGGLSLYNDKRATLKDFVYLDEPKKRPPENVHLKHNAIRSEYDGVAAIFYCYKGKWLVRMTD